MLISLLLAFAPLFIQTSHENVKFSVEYAITPKEKNQGLKGRENLNEEEGMLFIYEKEDSEPFWMDKTKIPLALLFINSHYYIVDIKYGTPFSRTILRGDHPYQYVLEINPKTVQKYQIGIGQKVLFDSDGSDNSI